MKDLFPYIGEAVLHRLLSADPAPIQRIVPELASASMQVLRNVRLSVPGTRVTFDGFQKLDLAMLIDDREVLPIEVKLGHTGLNRANVNAKLARCSVSKHTGECRISGNMLAVLSRLFDEQVASLLGASALHASVDGRDYPLRHEWVLIARRHILNAWSSSRPAFTDRVRFLALEEICEVAGKETFNRVVVDLLSDHDFFDQWISNRGR